MCSGSAGVRAQATGTAIADKLAQDAGAELRKITINAPPSVTLSSSKGGFPITILNGTDEAIRVGRLASTRATRR